MPYAYIHYPFENTELFENNFPGHFVAEGLDQTRGWLVSFPFKFDIKNLFPIGVVILNVFVMVPSIIYAVSSLLFHILLQQFCRLYLLF